MEKTLELQIPQLHLREWELQGPTAETLARISQEVPEEDFLLFRQTAILSEESGVDDETRANVLGLLEDFYHAGPEDAKFARGSMHALPIMLTTADILEDATGIKIDRALVWQGVAHDIGKEFVEVDTKHKSNIGSKDYDEVEMGKMEKHILYGLFKTMLRGAKEAAPLNAEHHSRQPQNPYGLDLDLTDEQELAVICVAIGDHLGAAKTRKNNRTEGMSPIRIWARARGAVEHTLQSYPGFRDDSLALSERIMEGSWSHQEIQDTMFQQAASSAGKLAIAA